MDTNLSGGRVNSKARAIGVSGNTKVSATTSKVASRRYFPGLLLKNGFLVRTTSIIKDAEMTDSINHPVRNCPGVALRT